MYIYSAVNIELNCTGFTGRDVDSLLPDFMDTRRTTVALTWRSSVNGPESFNVCVVAYAALAATMSGFLAELGGDLYRWCRDKLLDTLKTKNHPDCYISIKFDDIELYYHDPSLFSDSGAADETLLSFFESIPSMLLNIDPKISKSWEMLRAEGGVWEVKPVCEPSSVEGAK